MLFFVTGGDEATTARYMRAAQERRPERLPPALLGPRRWTNIELDLSRFAGKTVWLRAGRVTEAEKKGHELWSKLELGD